MKRQSETWAAGGDGDGDGVSKVGSRSMTKPTNTSSAWIDRNRERRLWVSSRIGRDGGLHSPRLHDRLAVRNLSRHGRQVRRQRGELLRVCWEYEGFEP